MGFVMKAELSKNDEKDKAAEQKQEVKDKNWPVGDYMIAVLFIAYAVFMFVGAYHFPSRARMGMLTSAKFTPMLLSTLVVILCVVMVIRTRVKFGRLSISGWFHGVMADERMRRSYVLMVMIGVYILLIGIIPFFIINLVFFLVIYFYLKIGTWKRIVLYSVISSAVVSYLVPYVFNLPVP